MDKSIRAKRLKIALLMSEIDRNQEERNEQQHRFDAQANIPPSKRRRTILITTREVLARPTLVRVSQTPARPAQIRRSRRMSQL